MLFLFLNDNKIEIEAYTLDVLFRREKKKHFKHEYVDFVLSVLFSFREEPHALTHKQIKSRQARESTNWQISLFLLCGYFFRFAFFLFFHCVVNFGDKYMTSIYSTNHTQPFAYIHTHDFNSSWNEWTNLHIWHFFPICTVFV